jgi:hypothetical protein
MVHREGKETYQFTFASSGTVTVELSGFPADCVFQIGSQGFQESDSSPVDWTDGQPGQPVKHAFRAQAGRPGTVWVELRSRLAGVSAGNWTGVFCSKDGPCYATPARGKPVEASPANFEGRVVRPPITFRLTAKAGTGGVEPPQAAPPRKTTTLRDNLLKFTFDYQEGWTAVSTERGTYRLSSRDGAPEAEAVITVKVIAKAENPDSSAWQQLLKVHEQLTSAGAQVMKLGPTKVAGQAAAFASHVYDAKNAQGKAVAFDHVQLVLDHGPNYCLISFVAPHDVFVKQAAAFKQTLASWRFLP